MSIGFHILEPIGRSKISLLTNFIFHRNQIFSIPDPLFIHNFPFLTRFPTPFPRRNPRRDPKFPGGTPSPCGNPCRDPNFPGGTPLPPRNPHRDPKFPGGTPSPRRNPRGNQNFLRVPLPVQEPAQGPKNPAGPPYMHIQGPRPYFLRWGYARSRWNPHGNAPREQKKIKKMARGGSRPCAIDRVSLYQITLRLHSGPRA